MSDDDYYKDGLIPMWRDTDIYRNGQATVEEVAAKRGERKLVYESVLEGHTGQVFSVAFNADGNRIVSGGIDGRVKVWDAERGHRQRVESMLPL